MLKFIGRTAVIASFITQILLPFALPEEGSAAGSLPVFWGIYPQGSFFDSSAADEIQAINAWIGDADKHISLGGTFADIEWPNPDYNVPTELEGIWDAGAVPFMNLAVGAVTSDRTSADIANGLIDSQIRDWADAYKSWATGAFPGVDGDRRAFIALLQEMNGDWVPYGQDPEQFKAAFQRIQEIFSQRGVPDGSVSWVFAPNGWSEPGHEFEHYYPGDSVVDVVGFSAYNIGNCVWQWPDWHTFETDFKPYLDRMRAMAPNKAIFITQTGTVDEGGDKDAWLDDTFTKLAAYPALRGIIYYHRSQYEGQPCDPVEWRFYAPAEGVEFTGIRSVLTRAGSGFGNWPPDSQYWSDTAFSVAPPGNLFDDVEPAHPFSGVEDIWYYAHVQALGNSGISSGCGLQGPTGKPLYCPDDYVTRAQMAVFLERGIHGSGYVPPPAVGIFSDVAIGNSGYWAADWVEGLYADGVTGGCQQDPLAYCPDALTSRAEMAVFLLRAEHGSDYTPPSAGSSTGFVDVPTTHWAADWIKQLAAEGITVGCQPGENPRYCPEDPVTRSQMAVFLVKTFNLPLP